MATLQPFDTLVLLLQSHQKIEEGTLLFAMESYYQDSKASY